jgi:hypothetical protein
MKATYRVVLRDGTDTTIPGVKRAVPSDSNVSLLGRRGKVLFTFDPSQLVSLENLMRPTNVATSKCCCRCKTEKPSSDLGVSTKNKGGRHSWCKACANGYQKQFRDKQ